MTVVRTLASELESRDRERFVGRTAELIRLECALGEGRSPSVTLVHGPGGLGKSTLLRELGRRAQERGWQVFRVEGRDLAPSPDALEDLLAPARTAERPLVLIDTFERIAALGTYLRRELLPSLSDRTVVVIAGRGAPDPSWFVDGWESIAGELELGGLPRDDALALLAAHGLGDARVHSIVDWAGGSPLALALAADAAVSDPDWSPAHGAERPEILQSLIRRLVENELTGVRFSALSVAALSRVTTPELLAAVLPESDALAAYERLEALTFTEPLGDGLALHDLVRKALAADFRRRDPERLRELRRRIVDYLYERARAGESQLTVDMAHLIENEAIRWGFGWGGAPQHRIDDVRPGDAEQVRAGLVAHGLGEWWPLTGRFFIEAPERVAVVRDADERVCAFLVAMTQCNAPPLADEDPMMGPWLLHARAAAHLGDSVLWHDSVQIHGDPRGRVKAMLGMGGILRSGSPNPRFAYLPINPDSPEAVAFARSLGATHFRELDFVLGPHTIECHRVDYGPGGLLAAQRNVVYGELGLAPPEPVQGPAFDVAAVRDALRNFRLPHELARSPLAEGAGAADPVARVEYVRGLLRDAADQAFGETDNERLLRLVLTRGYLEPTSSHEQAAHELSLSRAAYFRRLRVAAERVAQHLAGG